MTTMRYTSDDNHLVPPNLGDAGIDLRSLTAEEIMSNEIVMFDTGICVEIPEGHFGMIVPRSGLGSKGITVANSPGIIDSTYRGEIKVALINHSRKSYMVEVGDRIAQLVIVPFVVPRLDRVNTLSETDRGSGGFGSTGK